MITTFNTMIIKFSLRSKKKRPMKICKRIKNCNNKIDIIIAVRIN